MPLGFERLNERVQRPNKNINFIKPLDGPDRAIAQDILERVAAIVYPIMKKNHLYVMALEEFPPNREFWGRNFNAGEVIQLVLRSPHNGMWLPIPMVQSVMLHELAHNKEMNHSRRFHKHRLGYVSELAELKGKGYTGEGFWGKGQALHPSVDLTGDRQIPKDELPEDLCGGVYRRQKRKKKEPKKVDYQEQKKRRIIKKFGSLEGNTVGGDEKVRQELEKGKKIKGNPKVASSARGRDLRAEAALKRFEVQKKVEEKEEEEEEKSEPGSGSEDENGDLVRLDDNDIDMTAMMEEMSALACGGVQDVEPSTNSFPEIKDDGSMDIPSRPKTDKLPNTPETLGTNPLRKRRKDPAPVIVLDDDDDDDKPELYTKPDKAKDSGSGRSMKPSKQQTLPFESTTEKASSEADERICGACQVSNDPHSILCMVCSNVLRDDVKSWKCRSESCKNSDVGYRNSIDISYCGVCGSKR